MKSVRVRVPDEIRERVYRRRYIAPNAVTLAGLFCGFLSIIYATSFRYEKAALAIGLAILFDGLDGRVARRLNATSKFGIELDSFADLISFGVAPAILMYNWCFKLPADEFGVIVGFFFATCSASRLARFNITEPGLGFTGLPTPGAAGAVAALVHLFPESTPGWGALIGCTVLMVVLSLLMVSRVEFFSVKRLRIGHLRTLRLRLGWLAVVFGAVLALIWYHPGVGLAVVAGVYVLSGPVGLLLRPARRHTREESPSAPASAQ